MHTDTSSDSLPMKVKVKETHIASAIARISTIFSACDLTLPTVMPRLG